MGGSTSVPLEVTEASSADDEMVMIESRKGLRAYYLHGFYVSPAGRISNAAELIQIDHRTSTATLRWISGATQEITFEVFSQWTLSMYEQTKTSSKVFRKAGEYCDYLLCEGKSFSLSNTTSRWFPSRIEQVTPASMRVTIWKGDEVYELWVPLTINWIAPYHSKQSKSIPTDALRIYIPP